MCAVLGLSGLWWLLNVCTCVCVGVCASDQFYADRRMCASVIQTDVCVAVSYRQTCVWQCHTDRRTCASDIQTDVCVAVTFRQTCGSVIQTDMCAGVIQTCVCRAGLVGPAAVENRGKRDLTTVESNVHRLIVHACIWACLLATWVERGPLCSVVPTCYMYVRIYNICCI